MHSNTRTTKRPFIRTRPRDVTHNRRSETGKTGWALGRSRKLRDIAILCTASSQVSDTFRTRHVLLQVSAVCGTASEQVDSVVAVTAGDCRRWVVAVAQGDWSWRFPQLGHPSP